MSDSMAFLAGTAFAGIAALLLFKGGTPPPSYLPNSAQQPTPVQPALSTPLPPPPPLSPAVNPYNVEQQRVEMDRLKAQLEQQRTDIEQLKAQMQNQQILIQSLTAQIKVNAFSSQSAAQTLNPVQQQPVNPLLSGLLWALGGMILTVMGGVVLAAVFLLLSQQRSSGPVQLIHPTNNQPTYLPPRRRKRMEHPADEYYDQ